MRKVWKERLCKRNLTHTIKRIDELLFYATIKGVLRRPMTSRWKKCDTRFECHCPSQNVPLTVIQHLALKYERFKLRQLLFSQDPKFKKKEKYAEDESDIDDDWIAEHENNMKEKEIEKAEKKFAKENEKLKEDGEESQSDSVLQERLSGIQEEFEQLAKERETGKASQKKARPIDKIEESIDKLAERIKAHKLQIVDRDETKEVALGTRSVFG